MSIQGKDIAVSASTVSADPGQPGRLRRRATGRPDSRRWWALAAVSLAAFMTYLDNNIVNVAIPTTHSSPDTDRCRLCWMVGIATLTMLLSR